MHSFRIFDTFTLSFLDRTFDICRSRSQPKLHLYVLVQCLEIGQNPCLVHSCLAVLNLAAIGLYLDYFQLGPPPFIPLCKFILQVHL